MRVAGWMDRLSGLVERHPRLWIGLGDLESRMVREEIDPVAIDRPVYIAGLARSGSTILLELLAQHPDLATHRYRDYPALFTPMAWNWFVDRAASREEEPEERAHRDRIKVTAESPEAFEEPIWMGFFPSLHDPAASNVLHGSSSHSRFEDFYREHIRKLLALRGKSRYLSKGNYNVTRLGYLQGMFPDARFLLPIRSPAWHIASLMKQHSIFCKEGGKDDAVRRHMRRSGHYEFGLDRRAVNAGDDAETARIETLWADGREVEGWARYWAAIYGHVAGALDADPKLAAACRIVRYEALCEDPAGEMTQILDHAELDHAGLPELAASRVSAPDYYAPSFSEEESALIGEITSATARRFGYA